MGTTLDGDTYFVLDGKLSEIKRQMRQHGGYPFDERELDAHLRVAIAGGYIGTMIHFLHEEPIIVQTRQATHFPVRLVQFGHEWVVPSDTKELPTTFISEQIHEQGFRMLGKEELGLFMEQCSQIARYFNVIGQKFIVEDGERRPYLLMVPRIGHDLIVEPMPRTFPRGSLSTFAVTPA